MRKWKKLLLVAAGLTVVAAFDPISEVVSRGSVLIAQEVPGEPGDGDEGGTGDCEQTCSPLPASCNGGDNVCAAKPGCTVCVCSAKNSSNKCIMWTPQTNTPKQKTRS